MPTVKTYKDGNRFILVIPTEGDPEIGKKVNDFILDILGMDPPKEITGFLPAKDEPDKPPVIPVEKQVTRDSGRPFKETQPVMDCMMHVPQFHNPSKLTFGELVRRHGVQVATLYLMNLNMIDREYREEIKNKCRDYILGDLKMRSYSDEASDIHTFFYYYQKMLSDEIREMLSYNSYATVDDFLKGNDSVIRDEYERLIDKMKKKILSMP